MSTHNLPLAHEKYSNITEIMFGCLEIKQIKPEIIFTRSAVCLRGLEWKMTEGAADQGFIRENADSGKIRAKNCEPHL